MIKMNLKLNNEMADGTNAKLPKKNLHSIKEERRRTGRYIAILVGILLLLLAMYHAWVRRIPVVASLVVPALIMFIYVAWVLYSAARDKNKMMNAEAALRAAALEAAAQETHPDTEHVSNLEISVISNKEVYKNITPEETNTTHADVSSVASKIIEKKEGCRNMMKPIILVNDKPPDETDQEAIENINLESKIFKNVKLQQNNRRYFKSNRHPVFKRSYSIA